MQASHHTLLLYDYTEQHGCPLSMNEEANGPETMGWPLWHASVQLAVWKAPGSPLSAPAVREGTETFLPSGPC